MSVSILSTNTFRISSGKFYHFVYNRGSKFFERKKKLSLETLREDILEKVIKPVIPEQFKNDDFKVIYGIEAYYVNDTAKCLAACKSPK